jgi:hypothetical protein
VKTYLSRTIIPVLIAFAAFFSAKSHATAFYCVSTTQELYGALTSVAQASESISIQLVKGIYTVQTSPEIYLSQSKQLTISGGFEKDSSGNCSDQLQDASASTLDAGGTNDVFSFIGGDSSTSLLIIRNLSIRNGYYNAGGAAIDLRFGTNSKANIILDRIIFTNNRNGVGAGGAVLISGDSGSQQIRIANSLFQMNSAQFGSAVSIQGAYQIANLVNNTFVGNVATFASTANATIDLAGPAGAKNYISNDIIWGNVTATQSDFSANADFTVSHSDVERFADSGAISINVLSSPPDFVGLGSYRPAFGSVTIGSGTDTPPGGLSSLDLDGQQLIAPDGSVDMGAYGHDILFRSRFDY